MNQQPCRCDLKRWLVAPTWSRGTRLAIGLPSIALFVFLVGLALSGVDAWQRTALSVAAWTGVVMSGGVILAILVAFVIALWTGDW